MQKMAVRAKGVDRMESLKTFGWKRPAPSLHIRGNDK